MHQRACVCAFRHFQTCSPIAASLCHLNVPLFSASCDGVEHACSSKPNPEVLFLLHPAVQGKQISCVLLE